MFYKSILTAIIVLSNILSFSQSKYLYYFDKDFNIVDKSKADFNGVGAYENGNFELMVYNQKNNWPFLVEHFTDSTLATSNGLFSTYYANKTKEWEGNYLQGKQNSLWRKWNVDGKIIDSSLFDNGEKIMRTTFTYYFSNSSIENLSIDSFKVGTFTEILFDEKGKIVLRTNFKKNEDSNTVFKKVEIDAQFPGGPAAWQRYVTRAIQANIDEFTNADYGTCLVRFIVDITGEISNVEALTMKGTRLAKVALKAIKNGPNWVPAQLKGRPVRAFRLQPVTLQNPGK